MKQLTDDQFDSIWHNSNPTNFEFKSAARAVITEFCRINNLEAQPAADDKPGAMTPEQINEVNNSLWAELDDIKEKTGYNAYREATRGLGGHWTLMGYLLNLKHRADDKAGGEPVYQAQYIGDRWTDVDAQEYERLQGSPTIASRKLYTRPQPQSIPAGYALVPVELLRAANDVIEFTEIAHRPPVRDALEGGRMVHVRLHALADLNEALAMIAAATKVK